MCKVEPMSTVAEPQLQPQNNRDPHGPSIPGQAPAPAPEAHTRLSLAVTPAPAASTPASLSTEIALDHDDGQFPSQASTVQQQQHHRRQLQGSEHRSHHHHPHQLHHHVDGSILAESASAAPQNQNQNQNQNLSQNQGKLEAANIAHFDALAHDFDKQNPFSAEFADRLSRALRRLSSRRSAGSSSSNSNDNNVDSGSLVLDEDATSVLDYACGSGTYLLPLPHFASA